MSIKEERNWTQHLKILRCSPHSRRSLGVHLWRILDSLFDDECTTKVKDLVSASNDGNNTVGLRVVIGCCEGVGREAEAEHGKRGRHDGVMSDR